MDEAFRTPPRGALPPWPGPHPTGPSPIGSSPKVSFDAQGFVDVAFPPQNPGEVAEWSKAALC